MFLSGVVQQWAKSKKIGEAMTHPIIASARRGNLEDADRLLTLDAGASMFVDDKGWTAAHYAAQLGKLPVLQRLHESNSRVLLTPTSTGAGKQPAHLAADWNELEVLQWIAGVDPTLLETVDKMDRTAVSTVAEKRFGGSAERARSWLGLGSESTVRPLHFCATLCKLIINYPRPLTLHCPDTCFDS